MANNLCTRKQPWSTYALHLTTYNPPSFILDPTLAYWLYHGLDAAQPNAFGISPSMGLAIFGIWLLLTKTVKLWPYFLKYPADLVFLPAQLIFGYLHGLIKIYTLLTLHKTTWGGEWPSRLASKLFKT